MGYESKVRQAKQYIEEWELKALKTVGAFIDAAAVNLCPTGIYYGDEFEAVRVGGNLKNSMGFVVDKKKKAVHIGNKAKYAPFVEKGTGPHVITPKTAQVLSWVDKNSQRQYAGAVYHPGTRPQPFLTPAFENNAKKIEDIVKAVKFASGAD